MGCDIVDGGSQHIIDDFGNRRKTTIYLHLKKYFRGTRFTSRPFLKCMEEKHKLGEVVCISGKVSWFSLLLTVVWSKVYPGILVLFYCNLQDW